MSEKISQLPQVTALAAGDLIMGVDVDGTASPSGAGGSNVVITAANLAAGNAGLLGLPVVQATTGTAGYTLVNGTGTILSWTAPNDGLLHRAAVSGSLFASALETGGNISLLYTDPGGNANTTAVWAGGLNGANAGTAKFVSVKAGTAVTLQQTVALSAGGPSTLWAELWAS